MPAWPSGNGRIEATEIDVATKLRRPGRRDPGHRRRLRESRPSPLARMQIHTLQAQHAEAVAGKRRAEHNVAAALRPGRRCAKATTPPPWPW